MRLFEQYSFLSLTQFWSPSIDVNWLKFKFTSSSDTSDENPCTFFIRLCDSLRGRDRGDERRHAHAHAHAHHVKEPHETGPRRRRTRGSAD